MNKSSAAILLIVDISGYTRFMREHTLAANHAKQTIVRLLKALIKASHHPLKVAELEGDAVFFYALVSQGKVEGAARRVQGQIPLLFTAFYEELARIDSLRICSCDACSHLHNLKLKQVVHLGDILIESIGRFEKLFGLDVILVHRMLKNSVPSSEYVMITTRLHEYVKKLFGLEPEKRIESFDGMGNVETLVFYLPPDFFGVGLTSESSRPPTRRI